MNILQPLAPFYIDTGLHIYESGGANADCGGDECPREHNFAIKHAAAHHKKGIRLGTVSEFRIGYKSDFLSEFSIISL